MPRPTLTFLAALAVLLAVQGAPAAEPDQPLMLGTAWYPEQWKEARWEADLALMERAHIGFVRVGEFAWSTLEPHESVFDFAWLDRAIRAAEHHHIRVVLGTPTAAPPAWLTAAYPDTLRVERGGARAQHGERQQFDFTSPRYLAMTADIAGRLAARYGHDPAVIGWQVDNELGEVSYGPDTSDAFQHWLREHYVTLDALNARLAGAYWSETYQDWSQIGIPPEHGGNPGLMLAWKRFVTESWRAYTAVQIRAIRAAADPRQKITTNQLGDHDEYDEHALAQDFDFAAWDEYVGSGHFDPAEYGAVADQYRGYKRQNFWVMETAPGTVNWAATNDSLDRGEIRALAWHAVGHGADAVAFWQWRSALGGQEQYHGTLLGPDGTPVPAYEEVAQIGADFARAAPHLAGTTVHAEIAILNDYPSRWAVGWQRHAADFDAAGLRGQYYRPLRAIARSIDVVGPDAPLGDYRLVVAPALNVLTDSEAAALARYVRGGGHLVLTPRSGMKDADNALHPERQPGPLAALLGARVAQFYALAAPVPVQGEWGAGQAGVWAERLETLRPDTAVLARYGTTKGGWLDGAPAAVTRRVGGGRITYLGAEMDVATNARMAAWMARVSGVAPVLPDLPAGLDVSVRRGAGRLVLVLTNETQAPIAFSLKQPYIDVLGGGITKALSLSRYGVAVLQAPY